jgi:hypothetical protein
MKMGYDDRIEGRDPDRIDPIDQRSDDSRIVPVRYLYVKQRMRQSGDILAILGRIGIDITG